MNILSLTICAIVVLAMYGPAGIPVMLICAGLLHLAHLGLLFIFGKILGEGEKAGAKGSI